VPVVRTLAAICACACALAALGCGSSSSNSSSSTNGGSSTGSGASSGSTSSVVAGALSAEARSAATGDIPDNQVFLVFSDPTAGWSMKYPEGWTQSGSGRDVTFRNKNNVVHVVIASGSPPTAASVTSELQALKRTSPSLQFTPPAPITISGAQAIKSTYTTQSPPDPVTGKSVLLIVDRYALARGGRVAIVDLGTQQGVDNVDAYRKMIESFSWR
jgi:hypothetical protein